MEWSTLRHAFDGGWFSYDLKVDPELSIRFNVSPTGVGILIRRI